MPLPDQSREYNFPPNAFWFTFMERFDRLPFFYDQGVTLRPNTTVRSITTTGVLIASYTHKKAELWTDLRFELDMSWWCNGAVPTVGVPFVVIDGTTTVGMNNFMFSVAAQHLPYHAHSSRVSGIGSGDHHIELFVNRLSGSGALTIDTNDCIDLIGREVIPTDPN